MTALVDFIGKGGPAIIAIMMLSVVLYSRCFKLLFTFRRSRRAWHSKGTSALPIAEVRRRQQEVRETFREQRFPLTAMIAAAPLLGLLGTVSGMMKTFETLAGPAADKSMESLAHGISEVLVATESGLLVALPALLMVWLAHREMAAYLHQLNQFASGAAESSR